MNTQLTLFTRYKNMINKVWGMGYRSYTATELNNTVGCYENPTSWKKMNGNPYYTTRSYQTLLKHLGCITMIKRGIWRINGPIPEWFGSFHFTGLKRGYDADNKYADHNCQYWKSLPDAHRVNPWIEVLNERKRVRENAQAITRVVPELAKREEEVKNIIIKDKHMNVSQAVPIAVMLGVDESKTIVEDSCISTNVIFTVTAPFGVQFKCVSWVNKQLCKDGTWEIEVTDTEIFALANQSADYKAIKSTIHLMMGEEAGDAWIDSLDNYARETVKKCSETIAEPVVSTSDVKTYTEDQVNQILKEFTMYMLADFKSTVQDVCDNLSEDEIVEFSVDYDRRIVVDFDADAIARDIKINLNDQADMSLRDFSISTVNFE